MLFNSVYIPVKNKAVVYFVAVQRIFQVNQSHNQSTDQIKKRLARRLTAFNFVILFISQNDVFSQK